MRIDVRHQLVEGNHAVLVPLIFRGAYLCRASVYGSLPAHGRASKASSRGVLRQGRQRLPLPKDLQLPGPAGPVERRLSLGGEAGVHEAGQVVRAWRQVQSARGNADLVSGQPAHVHQDLGRSGALRDFHPQQRHEDVRALVCRAATMTAACVCAWCHL